MRCRMTAGNTPKGEPGEIVCDRTVVVDFELRVRHVTTWVQRNLR